MGGRRPKDLPSADIFIHSGDVAKVGSDGELGDFNEWHLGVKKSPQKRPDMSPWNLFFRYRQIASKLVDFPLLC